MPKFRSIKPPIEARRIPPLEEFGPGDEQLYAANAKAMDIYKWVETNTQGSFDPYGTEVPASGVSIDPATGFMLIATLEGVMQAKPGDWIIRGTQGEFYPCKPDIFAESYDIVEGTDGSS